MSKRRGHGEGSIYQRKDGRWIGVLDLGYVDGKRRRKYFYADTRREVAAKLAAAQRDQQLGVPAGDDRITVERFLRRWLGESAPHTLRPRTLASYTAIVENTLIPMLGRIRLVKLQPADVQCYVNDLAGRGLSPYTIRNHRAVLRRALSEAVRWNLVSRNVAQLVTLPRMPTDEVEPLSPEQAGVLLNAVRGDRDELIYRLALNLGLRQGEILGLSWEAVDFDAGTLAVRRVLHRYGGCLPPRRAQDSQVSADDRCPRHARCGAA